MGREARWLLGWNMSKHGLICFVAIISATGAALAADAGGKAAIPNFATDAGTGWRIDRTVGVDDLLAAPGGGPGPITFERAHPYVPNGGGRQPTYRIADLSNPILQEWVKPAMKKANDEVLAGQAPYRAHERCWPAAVPGIDVDAFAAPVFLWQTPKEVVYIMNNGPEVRHIYLNVPHSQNPKPSWYGESVGHYEGDTLVVDTIGQNTETFVDNYRTPHSEKLHVVERFHLTNEGKNLQADIVVDDPATFRQPLNIFQTWRRVAQGPMTESSCAESGPGFFSFDVEPI